MNFLLSNQVWRYNKCVTSVVFPFKKYALSLLLLSSMSSMVGAQTCEPECSVSVVNAHPPQVLENMSAQLGVQIVFEGELLEAVSVDFTSQSADQLVRNVAEAGGYLVVQRGSRYTLYGSNVEEVTIALTPRHLSAEEGARHLERLGNINVLVIEGANAIILRGTSEEVRQASEVFRTLDFELPNVFLELLVVEYYHDDAFVWAYDILDGTKGKVSDISFIPGVGRVSGYYESLADLPNTFRLNLTALVQDSDAKVVTNPHIAVRSGQPGHIELREQLNIVLTNETENFGSTRRLQTLEAGVLLNVTPDVIDGIFVDLQVEGEVSVFVPAPQGQYAIDIQSVETRVLVESGKTLIIGGMVAKEGSISESGVPGLRRIPLLGNLFKSRTRAERYVETVIYITPYINDPSFFLPENIAKDVDKFYDLD